MILLDLVMPHVDGCTVLRELGKTRPHLLPRVIVLTAATGPYLRMCTELERVWCVRRKPLDIVDLREELLRCAAA